MTNTPTITKTITSVASTAKAKDIEKISEETLRGKLN